MPTRFYAARFVASIGFATLVGACAPFAPTSVAAPPVTLATSTAESSSQAGSVPSAAADPAPVHTSAPGQHLDVIGTVTALSTSTIDVDGVTYILTAETEVKGTLAVGQEVKLEFVTNADGSRTVIEAKGAGFFNDSSASPAD